ncbi:MAG TPA: FliG C-terminal domain-containing protein [Pirellulales bacterium]|nr:FliG C-terminal domain-containing protein [Pirellulales bacterium]
MTTSKSTLRKAAILIASLDERTARRLLDQMGHAQADRVREAVDALGAIDPEEQRRVIEEFCRVSPAVANDAHPGLELSDSLAAKLALPADSAAATRGGLTSAEGSLDGANGFSPAPETGPPGPFHFLRTADAEMLTPYLEREHPQTVAVVVSHLPPAQAASVLMKLTATLQADVLRRLSNLDEAAPEIVQEVERNLESWLAEQTKRHKRREAGLLAVKNILYAAGGSQRQLIANLSHHDRDLAAQVAVKPAPTAAAPMVPASVAAPRKKLQLNEPIMRPMILPMHSETTRLGTKAIGATLPIAVSRPKQLAAVQPPIEPAAEISSWSFEDVRNLDDANLAQVFTSAGTELTVLAVAGAPAEMVERLARRLTGREARKLRKALSKLAPTRLRDVEEAQQAIADHAARLADAGAISAPASNALAAA